MKVVDGLIAEGLVQPCGYGKSTGGRPAELLEFGGTQHAIIGVDLGGSKMFGAVADLLGHIQHEVYVEHSGNDEKDPLKRLCSLIEELLAAPRPATQQVWGIGIGVPSVTLRPEGVVVNAPSLGWRDFPLQQLLSSRFGSRILVENDVNLASLGEWEFGVGGNSESMVYITIGTGIGAGVLLNGQIHRGFNYGAGEIGHFVTSPRFLGQRYDGFGALEHVASGLSIKNQATQMASRLQIAPPADGWSAESLFAAAIGGQEWAVKLVDEIVDHLTVAIAGNLSNTEPGARCPKWRCHEVRSFPGGTHPAPPGWHRPFRPAYRAIRDRLPSCRSWRDRTALRNVDKTCESYSPCVRQRNHIVFSGEEE